MENINKSNTFTKNSKYISDDLYLLILSNMSDTVFMTDKYKNITYICPNVKFIFGYSANEMYPLRTIGKILGKEIIKYFKLAKKEEIKNIEWEIIDKYSIKHNLLINIKPILISNSCFLITCRDISELKSIQNENTLLSKLLIEFEKEKLNINTNIQANIKNNIIPILNKIKMKDKNNPYITILEEKLKNITDAYGINLERIELKLTPKEMEICNFISNGYSTKDISKYLNLSKLTIEKHRANIRKKFNIKNKDVNLATYINKYLK